jgi:hypothetical protein
MPAVQPEERADALGQVLGRARDAALQELRDGASGAHRIDRPRLEEVVENGEGELDGALRAPAPNAVLDRAAPLLLPREVGVVVADSVDAQHAQRLRHGAPSLYGSLDRAARSQRTGIARSSSSARTRAIAAPAPPSRFSRSRGGAR